MRRAFLSSVLAAGSGDGALLRALQRPLDEHERRRLAWVTALRLLRRLSAMNSAHENDDRRRSPSLVEDAVRAQRDDLRRDLPGLLEHRRDRIGVLVSGHDMVGRGGDSSHATRRVHI